MVSEVIEVQASRVYFAVVCDPHHSCSEQTHNGLRALYTLL